MFLSWTGIEFCQWFSCICSDDLVIFILHFVHVVYHTDLWVLSNLCVPGINPTWWLCVVLFLYCWIELIWVCSILSWFLEYFEKDRYSYLFYIFCRLPLWRHLILDLFLLGSYFCLIYYKFNFTDSSHSVQIVCFFLIQSWQVAHFLDFIHPIYILIAPTTQWKKITQRKKMSRKQMEIFLKKANKHMKRYST